MRNPLQKVTILGREVELLYSVSLYKILQDRNQSVVIDKGATWSDVTTALLKMIYAAYLNAIEVRQLDNADYNPDRLAVMDFWVWSEEQPKEFAEQIKICYFFITGQELKMAVEETEKKKTPKIKKSIFARIGEKFRTLLSGSAEKAK